jgi:hypothetical protein
MAQRGSQHGLRTSLYLAGGVQVLLGFNWRLCLEGLRLEGLNLEAEVLNSWDEVVVIGSRLRMSFVLPGEVILQMPWSV